MGRLILGEYTGWGFGLSVLAKPDGLATRAGRCRTPEQSDASEVVEGLRPGIGRGPSAWGGLAAGRRAGVGGGLLLGAGEDVDLVVGVVVGEFVGLEHGGAVEGQVDLVGVGGGGAHDEDVDVQAHAVRAKLMSSDFRLRKLFPGARKACPERSRTDRQYE